MKKNTRKLKKAALLLCSAVLLVCISIGATVAYLTSHDTVTNTFTVGNVKITLDEAAVDVNGTPIQGADRVKTNSYKLMPGHTYTKDPTVHVKAGSESSYIRMLVTVSNMSALEAAFPVADYADFYSGDMFLLQKLVTGWDSTKWACVGVDDGTYEFRYYTTVSAGETNVDLPALFEKIAIPGTVDNTALANLNNVTISIVAQAIQADGFNGADAAWTAYATAA